jgi:hypothetical protein
MFGYCLLPAAVFLLLILTTFSSIHLKGRFKLVKQEISLTQNRIWNDWNVSSYPNFLRLMHIPPLSWKLQKLKFIRLLATSLHEGKKEENHSFVMGFTGSSVTTGHDNYFSDAYPNIIYQNLLPLFKLLNISLIVRNGAVGSNPCYPYDACIETHVGNDLDIVGWEQSWNCAIDPRPLDTFTRQAYFMKKKVRNLLFFIFSVSYFFFI